MGSPPEDNRDILVRGSRSVVYLGMLFLPLLAIRLSSFLSLSDGLFALAAVVLALSSHPAKKAPPVSLWIFGAFLMILSGLAADFRAQYFGQSIQIAFNGVYVLFVWQWVIRQVLDTSDRLLRALDIYVIGVSISACVGILQSKAHILGYTHYGSRAIGLARQPDIAAATYALSLIFAIGLALHAGWGRRGWRVLCIAAIGIALLLTGSVSGLGSALFGLLVLFGRRGVRLRTLLLVVVLIVGIYMTATALEGSSAKTLNPLARFHATTTATSGSDTVNIRTATIKSAWNRIERSPMIGYGLDQATGIVYIDPFLRAPYPTHDFPLLIWYQGGFFFLVGTGIAMASATRLLVGRRRNPTRDILFAGVFTVLLFSLQDPAMFDRWLWLPFVLALAYRPEQHAPGHTFVPKSTALAPTP